MKNTTRVLRIWAAKGVQQVSVVGAISPSKVAWTGGYDDLSQAAEFVSEMTRDYSFAGEQLIGLSHDVNRKQSILDVISYPVERVKQWKEYRPIFISDARTSRGVGFWNKHAEDLARTEEEHGVPTEITVSIIDVEIFFGRNTGSYWVVDALSTLDFDHPPRAGFFREELHEPLPLTREQQVDPLSLTGSYAGAMGLPQFMPSDSHTYAVDFGGDGHINIQSDPTDAIGSVAGYSRQHGWVTNEPMVSVVEIDDESAESMVTRDVDPTMNLGELRARG